MEERLQDLVNMLVQQGPLYLALFAGLVFALARWPTHPAVAARAAAGFAWLLVFGLLADAWREGRLYELLIPDDIAPWPVDELSCAAFAALQALGFVWLLSAIFAGRAAHPQPFGRPFDERDDHL